MIDALYPIRGVIEAGLGRCWPCPNGGCKIPGMYPDWIWKCGPMAGLEAPAPAYAPEAKR